MYVMHSCLLSHKYEQLLLKAHFQNPYFLGLKALLNQMCSKRLQKNIHQFQSFCLFNHQCSNPLQFSKGMVHIW